VTVYDSYARLEPRPGDRDLQRGFAGAIHDPCWFLARQWQMGEFQGENTSSPLLVKYKLASTRINAPEGYEDLDPVAVPAETLVEHSRDDAWTMGRRIAAGRRISTALPAAASDPRVKFQNPPPPYDRFNGQPDGMALWHLRAELGVPELAFGSDAPPADRPDPWRPDRLVYEQDYPAGGAMLGIRDHRGEAVDWYSVDASANPAPDVPPEAANAASFLVLPAPLEYPGAPNPRWWQIEDTATDIGGYPPDTAHFPTMLLIDLICTHGDDWFLFPVSARAGRVVTISEIEVLDAFGRRYSRSEADGVLTAPADWSLFRCRGMEPGGLVLWNVAELPLEGPLLERVQFGIDDAANLLWAVERVIDGREFASRDVPVVSPVEHPPYQSGSPSGDATKPRLWAYIAGEGMAPGWQPYTIDDGDVAERLFAQHRLIDYSRQVPYALPKAAAEVLKAGTQERPTLHRIEPAAIPSNGFEIERRKKLARDCQGNPLLWTQRQRKPLRSPPARILRYDVAAVQRTD
jgi:hypothetical protein